MDATKVTPGVGTRAAVAELVPSSLDEATRTVEVVFATGHRVKRFSWDGPFFEELSLDPAHVRMGRLSSGRAPVLNSHNVYSPTAHVGVVERAWISNGEGRAVLRFARDDDESERVWNKVRQGILRSVSVGYSVHKAIQTEKGEGQPPVFRVVDWEPLEISPVAIPADPQSIIRSNPTHEGTRMTLPNEKTQHETPEEIRALERQRCGDITTLVRRAQLPETLAEQLINSGAALEAARAQVLEALVQRSEATPVNEYAPAHDYEIRGQRGAHGDFIEAASDALVMRAGITVKKPHAAAGDLHRTSVLEMARTALSRSGGKSAPELVGMRLIQRSMSTSDFPLLLENSIRKSIGAGYEEEPATFREWTSSDTVPDFRPVLRPVLSSVPELMPVSELGEYKSGPMSEAAATYRVSKYGVAIHLSWELLLNDDLGAWLRVQPGLGQVARRKEADLLYGLFAENGGAGPTMADGKALFHADHKNIAPVAGQLDATSLDSARLLLRRQTALGGGQLSAAPRFLICGPELEGAAERVLALGSRPQSAGLDSAQPTWVSSLVPIIENRLGGTAFYIASAPGKPVDGLVVARLAENEGGPYIEREDAFIRDATSWKCRHVVGVKALDFRSLVKVPITQ
ncbi:prohead protease/major capsid protein fusion protein [Stigmatella erecta]|uniref:Prohead serine protease n=1 Tax=Stigmatella erecta TaxID=83460 RepID=A0A1I0J9W7_9BACT|nr:prohead protease/major capsid protein fusion protein [Stigmatella erecta]SEU06790.1 prohead serine protease [Stigmatella erecta]